MATFTSPKDLGDLLLVEVCPGWTQATLPAGTDYPLGVPFSKHQISGFF